MERRAFDWMEYMRGYYEDNPGYATGWAVVF